jgi:AcrR family transcriptional regulator
VISILVTDLKVRQAGDMTDANLSAPRTARARVRAELTQEILQVGRRHLAEHGAAGLSLRAVARDLGMVSSALYRYFPSRDDLLTALILAAYESVADVGEAADRRCERAALLGRSLAICRAVRAWALANPHEYALIYGTPVPGYKAPEVTIEPVLRFSKLFISILIEAQAAGRLVSHDEPGSAALARALAPLRTDIPPAFPDVAVAAGLTVWTHVFGAISFELFGHRHNVIADHDVFFDHEMRLVTSLVLSGSDPA